MNEFTLDELNGLRGLWGIEEKNSKSKKRIYHQLRQIEKDENVKKAKYARLFVEKSCKRLENKKLTKEEVKDLKQQILEKKILLNELNENQNVVEWFDLLRKKEKIENREKVIREKIISFPHNHEYIIEHYNKQTNKAHIKCVICGIKKTIPINKTNASKIDNNIEIYNGNVDAVSLARKNYFGNKKR